MSLYVAQLRVLCNAAPRCQGGFRQKEKRGESQYIVAQGTASVTSFVPRVLCGPFASSALVAFLLTSGSLSDTTSTYPTSTLNATHVSEVIPTRVKG